MKLKDGFYANGYDVGGLVLDMPTKSPKKKKKAKVGDMARCEAEEFIYPFHGYVEHLYNHSVVIRIENTMECDEWSVKSKENSAVAGLVDMEIMNNEI